MPEPRYPNGEAPLDVLVSRPTLTKDFCLMFPGTAVKYDRLVRLAWDRHRWVPLVSGPDDAYRRLSVQIEYKRIYGPDAAAPGFSSHGGWFEGAETGALDIGNWQEVGKAAFYALAREAGFEPDYFSWEPWHIIDRTPWDVPAAPATTPTEDDMTVSSISVNGNQYGVAPEFISHYGAGLQAEITRQVSSATDELHNLGSGKEAVAKFGALLDGLGIPQDVLDNNGRVLNPQSGRHEANGVWSRRREAVAKLDRLIQKMAA